MNTFHEIKQTLLEKGKIDEQSVEQLKGIIFDDEGINKGKANFLFDLKDTFLDRKNHPDWRPFFINSITTFLLEDEVSPGDIDNEEAQWLRAKIQYDGRLDKIEKELLDNLELKSLFFPEILHFKSKRTLFFEAILFGTRYVTFLAVIGSMLASIALFATSTIHVAKALVNTIKPYSSTDATELITKIVKSIDDYLFAIVLLIFSIGVYELFINKIDVVNKQKDSRPNWLQINSIDVLKSSLGKVILMILIVSFFEHSLDVDYKNINDLLILGVGIFLISAALFLTHLHSGKRNKNHSNEPK